MLTDVQRNDRTIKYLNKEVELFVKFYSQKCGVNLTYNHDDGFTDKDDNKLWAIEFDGVTVISNDTLDEFEVGYESYIPGSYWEPESGDYVEFSKHKSIQDALFDVVKLYWQWEYRNFLESQWAGEVVAELEEMPYE